MGAAELQLPLQATADAAGGAIINTGPTQTNTTWELEQVTVQGTLDTTVDTPASTCAVYLNKQLVCATGSGAGDVAANPPSVTVPPGSTVTVVWNGLTPGTVATALLVGQQNFPG